MTTKFLTSVKETRKQGRISPKYWWKIAVNQEFYNELNYNIVSQRGQLSPLRLSLPLRLPLKLLRQQSFSNLNGHHSLWEGLLNTDCWAHPQIGCFFLTLGWSPKSAFRTHFWMKLTLLICRPPFENYNLEIIRH